MNKTRSSLLTLSLIGCLNFACGGPAPDVAVAEANAAPDPRRPDPRLYIDCRPVYAWLNDVYGYELVYVTATYEGASGSATDQFYVGNGPVATGNVFAFGDIDLEGSMLADNLDFSVSGVRPTRGSFTINRLPRVVQGRGGPTTLPGIIGPSANDRPVTRCEIVREGYDRHAVIEIPASSESGTLTLEVHQYVVGG